MDKHGSINRTILKATFATSGQSRLVNISNSYELRKPRKPRAAIFFSRENFHAFSGEAIKNCVRSQFFGGREWKFIDFGKMKGFGCSFFT